MKKTVQRHESDAYDNIKNQFSARKVEFHMEVTMTYTVFWDMTQFNWFYIYTRFGEIYSLHFNYIILNFCNFLIIFMQQ